MKHWGKKLVTMMVCAAIVIGMMPGMLSAAKADKFQLWVGDVQVTSTNTSGTCDKGGKWSYDVSTNTLTLEDAKITTFHQDINLECNIVSKISGLTILLKGTNSLSGAAFAVFSDQTVHIKGQQGSNASLTASGSSSGIDCAGGVTISDVSRMEVSAGSEGINASTGDIEINNSTVTVKGSDYGISTTYKSVTIKNSIVTTSSYFGIFTGYGEKITIQDSTVNAMDGGLHAQGGSITIKKSKVDAGSDYCGILTSTTEIDEKSLVVALGPQSAISGMIKNAWTGTGWDDMEGTKNRTAIPISTTGQYLEYKKVKLGLQAADPQFSLAGGTYTEKQQVTISCATEDAEIWYTTDGTTPTKTAGTKYSGPITVDKSMTIKAIAAKPEHLDSEVASADYKLLYHLVYDGNGGSGEMSSQDVYDGDTFTFPKCGFTAPVNKAFDHWKMSGADGLYDPDDPKHNSIQVAINNLKSGVITVTAYWKKHVHDWSYSAKGATITAKCDGAGTCGISSGLELTISKPSDLVYDGKAKAAALNTDYNKTAFPDTYKIQYEDKNGNPVAASEVVNAGSYTAKVTAGKATAKLSFKITPADPVVTAPKAKEGLVYTGSAQELITAGAAEGGTMQYALGADAATAPAEGWGEALPTGTEKGSYYVWYKAAGDGNHKDSVPACVTVQIGGDTPEPPVPPTPEKNDISKAKTSKINNHTYTGKVHQPKLTVKVNGKKLTLYKDYLISFSDNREIGKATITLTGIGDYTGTKKVSFNIVPREVRIYPLRFEKKKLIVSWEKAEGIDGYEIEYSTNKKFKGAKKAEAGKKKDEYKISKLKEDKTYYVRIRAWKKVKGKKYYSIWSDVKEFKIK